MQLLVGNEQSQFVIHKLPATIKNSGRKYVRHSMLCAPLLFGRPVSLSLTLQFLLAACGIIIPFFVASLAHRRLHTNYEIDGPAIYSFLHVFAAALTCVPSLFRILLSRRPLSAPLPVFAMAAAILVFSMILNNYSVFRLSYATEVLFKSPKLLPVMVGNFVLLQRKLRLIEVITICIIVTGSVGIAIGGFQGRTEFEWIGIAGIFTSLALEAIVVNLEEKLLSDWKVPQVELMSLLFPIASVIATVMGILNGQFDILIEKVIVQPLAVFWLFLYAAMGAIGLHFIFFSVARFGSLQTVLFASLRKTLGALFSFALASDLGFSTWHSVSLVILAAGLTANFVTVVTQTKKEREYPTDDFLNGASEYQFQLTGDSMHDDHSAP